MKNFNLLLTFVCNFFLFQNFVMAEIVLDDRKFLCSDTFKQQYVKGKINDSEINKIYKFKQLRDDLVKELELFNPDLNKIDCLKDFYLQSLKSSTQLWSNRSQEDSCKESQSCLDESVKSLTFIQNLNNETEFKIKNLYKKAKQACSNTPQQPAVQTKQNLCCGNNDDSPRSGILSKLYPDISYTACVSKVEPTKEEILSINGMGQCLGNIGKEFFLSMAANIKSIVTSVVEIPSILSKIADFIAKPEYIKAFFDRLTGSIKDKFQSYNSCLNSYNQSQLICEFTGKIMGTLATPAGFGLVLKVLKGASSVSYSVLSSVLSKTERGSKLVAKLDDAGKGAQSGLNSIGNGVKKVKSATVDLLPKIFTATISSLESSGKLISDSLKKAKENLKKLNEKQNLSTSTEVVVRGESPLQNSGAVNRQAIVNSDEGFSEIMDLNPNNKAQYFSQPTALPTPAPVNTPALPAPTAHPQLGYSPSTSPREVVLTPNQVTPPKLREELPAIPSGGSLQPYRDTGIIKAKNEKPTPSQATQKYDNSDAVDIKYKEKPASPTEIKQGENIIYVDKYGKAEVVKIDTGNVFTGKDGKKYTYVYSKVNGQTVKTAVLIESLHYIINQPPADSDK